ncbi:Protein kinase superfamily protein [Rhynchospora pubera]|uniref:Protein kinase superfamily protein n=1 Tax=Rhynchospora pubera TaxID=906938 RepID=A0AAV8C2G4_9POAL|nr:Protein kinase superfamily protein [Rhynchospora pubera]
MARNPPMHLHLPLQIFIALSFLTLPALSQTANPTPLNCSDLSRLCTSFLAFKPNPVPASADPTTAIRSMFDTSPADIFTDPTSNPGYFFVRKNCSCLSDRKYLSNTTFTVPAQSSGPVATLVSKAYHGLAFLPNMTRLAKPGAVVSLHLLCGCSNGLWNYLLSYVLEEGDSVESLASRFGASMDSIETVNGLTGPDGLVPGTVLYVPLNSVPGHLYIPASPSPAPSPGPSSGTFQDIQEHHTKFPYAWVVGSMGVALVLIALSILSLFLYKSFNSHLPDSRNSRKVPNQPVSHKFQLLKSSSFLYGSGRYLCCSFRDVKQPRDDAANHHVDIPSGMVVEAFDKEKPVVFTYQEVLGSTDSFSDSNLLGHGTYGSVYYSVLREQEVAIKRMTATKTKEFIAEMKVLCRVHHANLVELIGYAASNDELFLIYEYAQKGSLKNHLHDPQTKGQTSLSWISRVQIALDAARGLEYIHEHTRDHYVHRDIKTSNILLDSSFRAKISDFGLSKLVVKSGEEEASVTKVVGTFGYLAPEYLRDGLATTKSDVYAYGVVLFELISGKEAITCTEGINMANSERRSLASVMLNALRNTANSMSMESLKESIDPNLMDLYPRDCLFKMAMLAKRCVDEDPILRPDMKQVVISLSQILLSSIEWEATLAGNSQIFSGLVQGR